jgi:hypothetical protein
MKENILYLVCVVLFVDNGQAEVANRPIFNDRHNIVYTSAGFDMSIITWTIGYGHAFPLHSITRSLILNADFAIPTLRFDLHDFRIRVGVRINTIEYRCFALPIAFNVLIRGTENKAFQGIGIGTELGVVPGYYAPLWCIGAEIVWDQEWTTYIKHSSFYKNFMYTGAIDGWYYVPAFFMRYGARAGLLIREKFEIVIRGGFEQHGKYDKLVPPFYAILGLNIRF